MTEITKHCDTYLCDILQYLLYLTGQRQYYDKRK